MWSVPRGRGRACCLALSARVSLSLSTHNLSLSLSAGLCSDACLFRLARCPSPKLLRAHSAEKRRPVPTFQKVPLPSGPAPAHSLGDLKGSWPGRGLVTRFLQMSRKAPEPSGNGAHGHKQVGIRGAWEDTQESLELPVGLGHTDAHSCVPSGAPEPVGPARPREPPPSKLRRSELRLLSAAPPVWPPAGAWYPTPQPQPQWGQPGNWAVTWASCHTEQMNTGAVGTSWLGPAAPSIPLHWLAQKEIRSTPHKRIPFPPTSGGSCCLPLLLWPGRASVLWCMGVQAVGEMPLLTALEEEKS